jgi:hypothetical protein
MKPRLVLMLVNLALVVCWLGSLRPGSWSDGHFMS